MAGFKGKSRRMGTVDLDTGEIFEGGVPVWVKAKVKWSEGFVMGFQESLIEIAADKDMTHEMTRVWLMLLGKISFENWVAIPQKEISEKLNMHKSNVSKAIKKLIDKGLLLKGPKLGHTSSYKINSHHAWKGSVKNLKNDRLGQIKDFYEETKKIAEKQNMNSLRS